MPPKPKSKKCWRPRGRNSRPSHHGRHPLRRHPPIHRRQRLPNPHFDGFQNQLFDKERPAPTTVFKLPFHDNLQDNCIFLASGNGYVDAGFSPVKLSPKAVAMVDLMLLEDNADFKFQTWAALKNSDPVISNFISVGSSDAEAKAHYDNVRQTMPPALASLLNLATAMKAIQLPNKTPLDYFKEILWDESLAQDRFFGYADKSIVDQVRRAAMEHEFAPNRTRVCSIPMPRRASNRSNSARQTSKSRSTRRTRRKSTEWTASKVEPDIDYFQDLGAQTLLEVIPNSITHGLTDPKEVYVLRWIAGRQAGVPEFAPPYTIAV
jgi:hypothetical protein